MLSGFLSISPRAAHMGLHHPDSLMVKCGRIGGEDRYGTQESFYVMGFDGVHKQFLFRKPKDDSQLGQIFES